MKGPTLNSFNPVKIGLNPYTYDMKKLLYIMFLLIIETLVFLKPALAVENPLAVPNNKFGIHILFTEEIKDAAKLVNSSGGDWGYVTIPIQAGDKDSIKWQKFMDEAKVLHVIPIIRLATEGDYFNTKVWRKPVFTDILDFTNFLDSLSWPTKNRYIIIFNEPNRGDEWGGAPNPSEYADILNYAVSIFKSKNEDFFIISAGLDNAAETMSGKSYNEYGFLRFMNQAVPGIFFQMDGLGSHSYPNPGFSQPPSKQGDKSIASFRYEKALVRSLGANDIPVFITETGWSQDFVPDNLASSYFKEAFEGTWNDKDILAVTPFLLRAGVRPFNIFSFITKDGSESLRYKAIWSLSKIAGKPMLSENFTSTSAVLGQDTNTSKLQEKNFSKTSGQIKIFLSISPSIKNLFKWLLKI